LFRLLTEKAGVEESKKIFYDVMDNVISGNSRNSITEKDTLNVERSATNIANQIRLLGDNGAKELLAKLAIWAKHNGYDLLKLILEREVKAEFDELNKEFS